jgi:hypothetical protein
VWGEPSTNGTTNARMRWVARGVNRPRMGPRMHEWGGWRVGRTVHEWGHECTNEVNRPRMGPRIHEWGGWRVGRTVHEWDHECTNGVGGEWRLGRGEWRKLGDSAARREKSRVRKTHQAVGANRPRMGPRMHEWGDWRVGRTVHEWDHECTNGVGGAWGEPSTNVGLGNGDWGVGIGVVGNSAARRLCGSALS